MNNSLTGFLGTYASPTLNYIMKPLIASIFP